MAKIWVDGRMYEADAKQNLLHACLSQGFDLPYFCWHPALGSVGACRQCAVKQFKDETDQKGKLVMACMTPAAEGSRISIQDPDAVEFRKAIVEGLMQNHPHDCPVCDEGGECHLQDMTVMTGHDYRAYRFEKRTFRNQYLGPLVNHEMNRCIQCYRCVRYYREYAGGDDLNAFALRDIVFFGRERDGVLENEFSGNLVEICPTGVFTDRTLKQHYTRKWDLQFAPSICVHCGLGCNTSPAERYGKLRRIVNRYNHEVNGYFLCDRGRFGYEFVNSQRRIHSADLEGDRGKLRGILAGAGSVLGIGSPRASLESNFALRKLVGEQNFVSGMEDGEYRLARVMLAILQTARSASLRDIEESDAVLILGEDVTNVAPRMALSVRQAVRRQPMEFAEKLHIPLWLDHSVREAVQDRRGPLFIATPTGTRLDEIATEVFRLAPDDIASFGQNLPERIKQALKNAKRPLVIAGGSLGSEAIIQAAAGVAREFNAGLAFTMPEPNTYGAAMLGGGALSDALGRAADIVIILENDLYRRAPREQVDAFLAKAKHVVVLDHLANETTAKAELLLAAGTFAESDGTFVSSEGRAQRFFQVFPCTDVQESWRWLHKAGSLDEVIADLIAVLPEFAAIRDAAPPASFRIAGAKVPRESHRYSGRTAMLANIAVSEPKPPDDPDSALNFSMEGAPDPPPPPLIPFFWSPGWNSIQSLNKFQTEVGESLRGATSGVRLVPPGDVAQLPDRDLEGAVKGAHEFLIVPIHHIFASEELSIQSPAVAELAPKPYLSLNPRNADALQAKPDDQLRVLNRTLPLRIDSSLPDGVAGMLSAEYVKLPAYSGIEKP